MVMSHLGRPQEGAWSEADSLAPVAARLSELLGREVPLVRGYLDGVEVVPGQLVLLENCRMNAGEKADGEALSRQYAALCDVFVMDAFGTAHRAQASTHGVIRFAKQAAGGPLLMAEPDALAQALDNPARPLLAIVAGSKVSTKLELLSSLVGKVDQLIVGGGIANTFIAAEGFGVGKSLFEADLVDTAKQIMADAKARGADIPVPTDVVVAPAFKADAPATVKPVYAPRADDLVLDLGPGTSKRHAERSATDDTGVWDRPGGGVWRGQVAVRGGSRRHREADHGRCQGARRRHPGAHRCRRRARIQGRRARDGEAGRRHRRRRHGARHRP